MVEHPLDPDLAIGVFPMRLTALSGSRGLLPAGKAFITPP
jgi:hypothetical protein